MEVKSVVVKPPSDKVLTITIEMTETELRNVDQGTFDLVNHGIFGTGVGTRLEQHVYKFLCEVRSSALLALDKG